MLPRATMIIMKIMMSKKQKQKDDQGVTATRL